MMEVDTWVRGRGLVPCRGGGSKGPYLYDVIIVDGGQLEAVRPPAAVYMNGLLYVLPLSPFLPPLNSSFLSCLFLFYPCLYQSLPCCNRTHVLSFSFYSLIPNFFSIRVLPPLTLILFSLRPFIPSYYHFFVMCACCVMPRSSTRRYFQRPLSSPPSAWLFFV